MNTAQRYQFALTKSVLMLVINVPKTLIALEEDMTMTSFVPVGKDILEIHTGVEVAP